MSDKLSEGERLRDCLSEYATDIVIHCHGPREGYDAAKNERIDRIAAEFSRPYRERIAELEAEHALSWNAFEKEALTAIGPEIIGSTVDAGSHIPGMIQRLHDRYRAEIQRGDAQRAAMAEQLETYKRLANMKRTTKRDA